MTRACFRCYRDILNSKLVVFKTALTGPISVSGFKLSEPLRPKGDSDPLQFHSHSADEIPLIMTLRCMSRAVIQTRMTTDKTAKVR